MDEVARDQQCPCKKFEPAPASPVAPAPTRATELENALAKLIERFKMTLMQTHAVADEEMAEAAVANERAALAPERVTPLVAKEETGQVTYVSEAPYSDEAAQPAGTPEQAAPATGKLREALVGLLGTLKHDLHWHEEQPYRNLVQKHIDFARATLANDLTPLAADEEGGVQMVTARFEASECGRLLRRVTTRLKEGHLYNAVYQITELQQAVLREIGQIRHGKQTDASWLAGEREAQEPRK
jgi:hypothetical protein